MSFERFTLKNIGINILLVIIYLLWNSSIGEVKAEHYMLSFLWLSSYYAHEKSRKFILGFSIFFVYLIVYDSMRFMPNYQVSQVHIQDVYEAEKAWFGIMSSDVLLTPNEYLALHTNRLFDFLSGFFYINWLPIPIAFAIYLYFKDKYLYTQYALVFLFVNIFGFIMYYIFPAAPPWYVALHGFEFDLNVLGNEAGLGRFDEIIGVSIFENMYNKNANVFAAIPSLHAAYPTVAFLFGIKKGMGKVNWLFGILMIGIWISAVYSNHHYIIDVALGAGLALLTFLLFNKLVKQPAVDKKIKKFIEKI